MHINLQWGTFCALVCVSKLFHTIPSVTAFCTGYRNRNDWWQTLDVFWFLSNLILNNPGVVSYTWYIRILLTAFVWTFTYCAINLYVSDLKVGCTLFDYYRLLSQIFIDVYKMQCKIPNPFHQRLFNFIPNIDTSLLCTFHLIHHAVFPDDKT